MPVATPPLLDAVILISGLPFIRRLFFVAFLRLQRSLEHLERLRLDASERLAARRAVENRHFDRRLPSSSSRLSRLRSGLELSAVELLTLQRLCRFAVAKTGRQLLEESATLSLMLIVWQFADKSAKLGQLLILAKGACLLAYWQSVGRSVGQLRRLKVELGERRLRVELMHSLVVKAEAESSTNDIGADSLEEEGPDVGESVSGASEVKQPGV